MEGKIYSVEEVSELLGIPRPTLYRYLREYSIPSFRKSGRISIPEDSFEKIRQARDLHKEGLGTGSVRMRLRESGGSAAPAPDTGELAVRLDRLSRDLEGLKGDPKALEEASSPHALRTILARQSLLMSTVFNLTEMVEELLRRNGPPRRQPFEEAVELQGRADDELEGPETRLARSRTVEKTIRLSSSSESSGLPAGPSREFGSLAKRRRRGALLALVVVCAVAAMLFSTMSLIPGDWENASQAENVQTQVPDLSGLTYGEAGTRLQEARLVIGERESQEGEVAGQNPEAGAEIRTGETVNVTLEPREGSNRPETNEGASGASPAAAQYGEDVFEYAE